MMAAPRDNTGSPPPLKGEPLMGNVNKLSNWGWSMHPRFKRKDEGKLSKKELGKKLNRKQPCLGLRFFLPLQAMKLQNHEKRIEFFIESR